MTRLPPNSDGRRGTNCLLLCRDRIEITGGFFVEKRSLCRVASAPMLLSTWDSQETAWPHAFAAGFILVQICPLHDDDPNIVGVGVHPGIETGHELGECGMGSFTCVAPDCGHGYPLGRGLLKIRLAGGNKDHFLILLSLHSPDR